MTYSVQDHIQVRRVSSIAASPDGTWLAVSVQRLDLEGAKYVSDIWRVSLDGSPPVQLTRGDTRDTDPCFRHDGALAFLSNRRPNETKPDDNADKRSQVWIFDIHGGEPRQLTDEPLGVEAFRFAAKADRLVMLVPVIADIAPEKQREMAAEQSRKGPSARHYRRQPVRYWDHWLHENHDRANTHLIACASDGSGRLDLTPNARRELSIEPQLDVSADGTLAAVTWQTPGADRVFDSTILLIHIPSRKETRLGVQPRVNHESVSFSPDGRILATIRSVRSPQKAPRPLLTLIDTESGAEKVLAAGWDRWPQFHAWSSDGKHLFVTADDDGHTPVFRIDARTGDVERITAAAAGGAHSDIEVLKDGRLAGIRSTLLEPPECFVIQAAPESVPHTLARLSGQEPADWAVFESVTAPSTDGEPIQFLFVKPKEIASPLPTLLWIHGGPIAMNTDGWHWRWNPLLAVAQGYAVALPNPRGSTGFGQDFIQGIWGNAWGGQCYRDLMCVTDALQGRADVDSQRIMAMGGSFGGYMTNWIGTQTDRFRCLVTHASIFTMAQFTGTTDLPAWWYLEMGGEDPYDDALQFERYAPIRYVRNWKTPALIIHGERDYRCPVSEGLNLFEALQYHGVPSEMLIFPDENHWILKPRNIVVWYETVLEFLTRHMK